MLPPAHVDVTFGGLAVLAKTERCPACGYHIGRDRAEFATDDKPLYRLALFLTSDGFYVASKKFHALATEHGFTGVEFVPLANGRFVLRVARKVVYDLSKNWVNQEGWCPECQNYRRNLTVPGSHVLDDAETPIGPWEIVESQQRWGVEVGLRTAQYPDLIVGGAVRHVLEAAKFPRVSLIDVGKRKRC